WSTGRAAPTHPTARGCRDFCRSSAEPRRRLRTSRRYTIQRKRSAPSNTMQTAPQNTLYDTLVALPEGITGEILEGQLHTQPRPSGRHARAESALHSKLFRGYDEGDGGPGGWWILIEPELHFVRDREVAVPDIAGWRRARLPRLPDDQPFEVVPDWLCEILSPSTESKDRRIKMPFMRVRCAVRLASRSRGQDPRSVHARRRSVESDRRLSRKRSCSACRAFRRDQHRSC